MQPASGCRQYSPENTTSWAVSGVPSDHWTSFLSFQVMERRSEATPPFATVGISSTSTGTMVPFSSSL